MGFIATTITEQIQYDSEMKGKTEGKTEGIIEGQIKNLEGLYAEGAFQRIFLKKRWRRFKSCARNIEYFGASPQRLEQWELTKNE